MNIAAVYGYGHTSNGAPFVVTHLCEGTNLAQAVREDGPFETERALKLFIQISDAMAHAHFKSVVHRDLKPSNVVLSRNDNGEETARVIDFGMATVLQSARSAVTDVTKTGEVFGSPHYMSPEQCRGDKVDERSDIYSFGCLMYEVINGKQPFGGLNLVQVIMRQLNESAPDFDETRAALGTNGAVAKDRAPLFGKGSSAAISALRSIEKRTANRCRRWQVVGI